MTEEGILAFRNAQRFAAEHVKESLDRFQPCNRFSTTCPQGAPVTRDVREMPRRGSASDFAEMRSSPAPSLGLTAHNLRAIGNGAKSVGEMDDDAGIDGQLRKEECRSRLALLEVWSAGIHPRSRKRSRGA